MPASIAIRQINVGREQIRSSLGHNLVAAESRQRQTSQSSVDSIERREVNQAPVRDIRADAPDRFTDARALVTSLRQQVSQNPVSALAAASGNLMRDPTDLLI
ncbi:hypothetical protein FJZ36_18325 [Candidatus Poribacteria bacterium]|nr:hypothetical protein [Candidatus Poribacteria bacterium]